MSNLKPTTVTYGDLRNGDIILDKSGNQWPVSGIDRESSDTSEAGVTYTRLWLGSPPQHHIEKPDPDPVTVLRPESHADEVTSLEAETPPVEEPLPPEEIAEALDAEVVAEESAVESDARRTAEATGDPVTLPAFGDMTDLEKRSHLYLIHGVYAADVKFREKLVELHDEAHAGDADRVPHRHVEGAEVSA